MIVEYLTDSGSWERDNCVHESDGAGEFSYEQLGIAGEHVRRDVATCSKCGAYFNLASVGGLFDTLEGADGK